MHSSKSMKEFLLWELQAKSFVGHFGIDKTIALVKVNVMLLEFCPNVLTAKLQRQKNYNTRL